MQIQGISKIWNKELKQSRNGDNYISFSVSLSKKNQDGSYDNGNLRATAHKFNAEKMHNINDGDSVYFVGDIQPNNYTDQQGKKVYGFQLFTREIHKLENNNQNNGFTQQNNGFNNQVSNDDLPF